MQKTKLAQLLVKLDEWEIKAFDKFLQSPYFNNSPIIIRYWQLLKRTLPSLDIPSSISEKWYKKLYPGENFQEKKLRQLRSRLLKLLEEFLVVEQLKKDDFALKKRIADVYFEKEIKLEFEKRYHLLLKELEVEDFLTGEQLNQKLSLFHQLYFNYLHTKGDSYPKYLEASTQLLEQYYERQKQLYALEWFSLQERFNHAMPASLQSYRQELQATNSEQTDSLASLYENTLNIFIAKKEEEKTVYFICKEQIAKNYPSISLWEKNVFLKLLVNFCIARFREGKQLNRELFSIYSLGLSDKAIFHKGKMTNPTFLTIVSTAVKLKKFDWAKNFMEKEKWRLYEKNKEVYLYVAEASILFYSKKFKDCLELLSSLDYKYFTTMEVTRRSLQIRAAFECYVLDPSYQATLLSYIQNFEKYLTRKSDLAEQKRIPRLYLIRLIKRLIVWKEKEKDIEELENLRKEINSSMKISEMHRNWLIQHISTFKKQKGLSRTTQI